MIRIIGACGAAGLCLASTASASSFNVIGSVPARIDGSNPTVNLIDLNGILYGTTAAGGQHRAGTLYSVDPSTGKVKILYSFAGGPDGDGPDTSLTNVNGVFYGITVSGGANGFGTIFQYDPATNIETPLHALSASALNATLLSVGSLLYGTTQGGNGAAATIFSYDPASNAYATVYTFPSGPGGGVVPCGPLTLVNGILYGVTSSGGKNIDDGIVFTFDPTTGQGTYIERDNGSFTGALTYAGGKLYGYAGSQIFQLDPANGNLTIVANNIPQGPDPGPLLSVGHVLYGTAYYGGTNGKGTVYALDTSTGTVSTVYSFADGSDGRYPAAGLAVKGKTLYGLASTGGAGGEGTVVSIDISSGAETTLYSFRAPYPYYVSSLLKVGPDLYGTAYGAGDLSQGAIIKVNLATKAVTTAYSFTGGADGGQPGAELINVGGVLYGTSAGGGSAGLGTIFSFNPATKTETPLYSFAGGAADGASPGAALLAQGSLLYGTTISGGANGGGTIYQFNPASGAETMLYSLQGQGPRVSALINVNGVLYGTSQSGGASGLGQLFGFDPASNSIVQSYGFPGVRKGWSPNAALLNLGGILYGTPWIGGPEYGGVVFKFNTTDGAYKVAYGFTANQVGSCPDAALVKLGPAIYGTTGCGYTLYRTSPHSGSTTTAYQLPSGSQGGIQTSALTVVGHALYGAASGGGDYGAGYIFEYTP